MTHPYRLHASAALASVRAAWPRLTTARDAAQQAAADPDRGALRSVAVGSRGGSGLSDHIGAAIANALATREADRWCRVVDEVAQHLADAHWLVASDALGPSGTIATAPRQPWVSIESGIPVVTAFTAGDVWRELADADRVARRALRIGPDHLTLPDAPDCPGCGTRLLRVWHSDSDSSRWPVVCLGGCRCAGDGCGCGMDEPVRGVPHIWAAGSELARQMIERMGQ